MAKNHRKLFPTLSATNQTVDFPDFCDLPPQPPPPPSLFPPEHHSSPYVIIIVSLLASCFIIVSYYAIIAKSCTGWCSSSNNRQPQDEEYNRNGEMLDGNQVDHPIWFITTAGLQQSIINSITVYKHKKGEGLIESTECSVCLCEFQQDETLRLFPKCNHAFHIYCIDTWLRSHTNCPLCRARIITDLVTTPLVSVNQNPENPNTIVYEPRWKWNKGDEGGEIINVGNERILKKDINSTENGSLEKIRESGSWGLNFNMGLGLSWESKPPE